MQQLSYVRLLREELTRTSSVQVVYAQPDLVGLHATVVLANKTSKALHVILHSCKYICLA